MNFSIDHVHIEVTDQHASAKFFGEILDFEIDKELAFWADDKMGPLIIKAPEGAARLSLFQRSKKQLLRDNTIAFGMSGGQFLRSIERFNNLGVLTPKGLLISPELIVDHEVSWSVYFVDPDGNRFELTTYDYEFVKAEIGR